MQCKIWHLFLMVQLFMTLSSFNVAASSLYHEEFIGFTAWKQTNQTAAVDDTIIFDGVMINEGEHFDPRTSRFTCPYDGIYFVSVNFRPSLIFPLELTVNVLRNARVVMSFRNVNRASSNTILIRCSEGQQLYVVADGESTIYGEPGIPHSTFTVMMMSLGAEDYSDLAVQHDNGTLIGSTAWFQPPFREYYNGETLSFDQILYNEVGAYSTLTNSFECPVTGIYYISVNLHKYTSSLSVLAAIDKNTISVLHVEDDLSNNELYGVNNNRLIRCSEGELISVKATGNSTIEGASVGYEIRTAFSVTMLAEDGPAEMHESFIGFSAFKKISQSYVAGDTIEFDGILLNEGGHYQPLQSQFVCPLTGIYYVSVTCKKTLQTNEISENLQVDVEKSTDTIFRIQDSVPINQGMMETNSALVRCFQGEDISVKGAGVGEVYGDASKALTTFTVFMMYQTSTEELQNRQQFKLF